MKIIKLIEQLSGYSQFREGAGRVNGENEAPLEVLIADAKKEGFNLIGLDVAEIHDAVTETPYQSPVILLFNQRQDRHAVISQKLNKALGYLYRLDTYELSGEVNQNGK
ncbi:MAG: hypothetical protein PHD81_00040 [Candidatus Nanoarchaeia archaeon]|nr:hypothetical protein [Candidatus Nanoarchaeia archaeon]MDD5587482.1 hypothetical protein [Candidatus Nanoarchaeia archaeon]